MASTDESLGGVIFDLDNTLIDTRGADRLAFQEVRLLLIGHGLNSQIDSVLASFSKRLAKEPSDPTGNLCSDKWRRNLWLAALQEAVRRPEEQCQLLAKVCFEKWLQVRLAHLELLPATKEMLVRLRGDERLRLGLLTNGEASTQRDKINACACSRFFDAVCVAAELGAEKPLPAAYLQCCQRLDVLPRRTVMVGDSWECDISGSLAAGLRSAIWVNPGDQTPGPDMGGNQGWHSIHHVLEAEALIKKML
uniref:N-acylneuraminate-9-phosphatase n=1 Tax=Myxine glutinosa TaxID=7769 RepID=UPI00358F638A